MTATPNAQFQRAFADGMSAIGRGEYRLALTHMQQALALQPQHLDARYNVARLYEELAEPELALEMYEACLRAQSRWPAAWNNRGNVLRALGQLDAARASYLKCLETDPSVAGFVLPNLAKTTFDLRDFAQTLRYCESGLKLTPQQSDYWLLAAHSLRELRRFDEAQHAYLQALSLQPDSREARLALAHLRFDRLELASARHTLDELLQRHPLDVQTHWSRLAMDVPPIEQDTMDASLTGLTRHIDELTQLQTTHPQHAWHEGAVAKTLFYLAYDPHNHRDILTQFGDTARQALASIQPPLSSAERSTRRIRLGIVSEYLRAHSVWEALVQGWVKHLDRDHFEVHLFHLGHIEDAQTEQARLMSDSFTTLSHHDSESAQVLAKAGLDALIFPDLGISARSYRLACLRLAPVQLASWGHPETSGLRHLEGFLSADAMEPSDASTHYVEPLIRLPNLGCCIEPVAAQGITPFDRERWGLSAAGPLLVCGGTPFKYRASFDAIAVELAKQWPQARLVFFEYSANPWYSNAVKQRMEARFVQAGLSPQDHLHWLPWLDGAQFLGLMQSADVFLDTVGFSGFNTALQALQVELPVVAWEGEFLRGRLASGVLRHIGLSPWVASDAHSYVQSVGRLLAEPAQRGAYQTQVRACLQPDSTQLFGDVAPVRALENWLRERLSR